MTTDDEVLIQRCVDDEASADERREIMQRFDERPEGWKLLACSFLEEQLFARATKQECASVVPSRPVPAGEQKKVHWFHHPVTSLALSVCVAFMAGLLVRGEWRGAANVPVAESSAGSSPQDSAAATTPDESSASSPTANLVSDYKVRLMENGQPTGELPVYSLKDYAQRSQEHWRNSDRFGTDAMGRKPKVRTIWLSAPDGHIYVIPVEEFSNPWIQ